jgi:hypothetical protein
LKRRAGSRFQPDPHHSGGSGLAMAEVGIVAQRNFDNAVLGSTCNFTVANLKVLGEPDHESIVMIAHRSDELAGNPKFVARLRINDLYFAP